jgi:hypothetical protein
VTGVWAVQDDMVHPSDHLRYGAGQGACCLRRGRPAERDSVPSSRTRVGLLTGDQLWVIMLCVRCARCCCGLPCCAARYEQFSGLREREALTAPGRRAARAPHLWNGCCRSTAGTHRCRRRLMTCRDQAPWSSVRKPTGSGVPVSISALITKRPFRLSITDERRHRRRS